MKTIIVENELELEVGEFMRPKAHKFLAKIHRFLQFKIYGGDIR